MNKGTVAWESPSNIALIKYWGKKGRQIPRNPSVSMTLKNAVSKTWLSYSERNKEWLTFEFEGKNVPAFAKRIEKFLEGISEDLPFINDYTFHIKSENTFPHSTGIASSASAMSALAMCLCSMEEQVTGKKLEANEFMRKASYIARLGSGSASRSIYNSYATWGESVAFSKASNDYATPFSKYIHPIFKDYQDFILIVSGEKKKVSSTAGHALMNDHPFAQARYEQANANFERMLGILRSGDLESFIEVLENEALSLHGLMMNSNPSFTLLRPNTLQAIELIRDFRESTKIPLGFTLDAGPNIHLMFPKNEKEQVTNFVEAELKSLLEGGRYLKDETGSGPKLLTIANGK
ncbi:diphosphomevalonate/mevalonate 3,5-bisphosphate decarboxylase family protein [Marinifilum caeruleilacunae]|uniref:Diphosphomevalonate decarboxylase n=1 Tax=Marinifilum caeruleilacunae TaxID=2499076 RepID=A0ABX1WYZ8_9BACT|nr:diphosphomevalonate decarboxylase [Marinifilum caeruleilacunae]NOU61085.1 diphosphomevalonate decarboxylase [Marinifilum caeruleilacunae]